MIREGTGKQMTRLRNLAITVVGLSLASVAFAQPAPGALQASRFERNLEQIREQTLIRDNEAIPVDQRVKLEYGGYLSFGYLSLQDNVANTHGFPQSEVVGFARANFDCSHEFFIR